MLHKAIKGFEDYLITDTGRVYSLKSQRYLKAQSVRGYLHVQLWKNGKYKAFLIHRLVAEAFINNPINYTIVDHINYNPLDNRSKNLRWVDKIFNSKRQQKRKIILEAVNDETSIAWLGLSGVPGVEKYTLSRRLERGFTDFTLTKGKNKGRHFKILGEGLNNE